MDVYLYKNKQNGDFFQITGKKFQALRLNCT